MEKPIRYVYIMIAAFALVAFNANVLRALSVGAWIDVPVAAIVFVALVVPQRYAIAWAVSIGLWSELYSFLPFGVLITLMLGVCIYCLVLQRTVFTNFSVYTTALTGATATVIYAVVLSGISYALFAADAIVQPIPITKQSLVGIGLHIVGNTAAVTAAFMVGASIMRTLNRAFITPRRA